MGRCRCGEPDRNENWNLSGCEELRDTKAVLEDTRTRLAAAEQENARLNSLLYGGRCIYCGEVVGADTLNQDLSDEVLKEHIKTCAAHPYVQMKERAEKAESALALQVAQNEANAEDNANLLAANRKQFERNIELERNLKAAQQSAKEQFGAGCESMMMLVRDWADSSPPTPEPRASLVRLAQEMERIIREAAKERGE